MGARPTAEALIVRQPQEMSFSSGCDEIPRRYRLPSGHPNVRKTNQGRK